jgi:hypothetical protein
MKDTKRLVGTKLGDGEIHIGAPGPLKSNERLTTVDGGRRYAVIVED